MGLEFSPSLMGLQTKSSVSNRAEFVLVVVGIRESDWGLDREPSERPSWDCVLCIDRSGRFRILRGLSENSMSSVLLMVVQVRHQEKDGVYLHAGRCRDTIQRRKRLIFLSVVYEVFVMSIYQLLDQKNLFYISRDRWLVE